MEHWLVDFEEFSHPSEEFLNVEVRERQMYLEDPEGCSQERTVYQESRI